MFVSELKSLSRDCNFGVNLNEQLRDRIVVGINNVQIQKKLLGEGSDLTLEEAIKHATSIEAANKQASEIGGSSGESQIHKNVQDIKRVQQTKGSRGCWRCNSQQHKESDCPFNDKECYYCKKRGHISRTCPKLKNKKEFEKNASKKNGRDKVHKVDVSEEDFDDGEGFYDIGEVEVYDILRSELQREDPITTQVYVNGKPLKMEVDTGAAITIGGQNVLNRSLGKLKMVPTDIMLRFHNKSLEKPLGISIVEVEEGDQKVKLPIVVTSGDGPVLLGRNWLKKVKFDWKKAFSEYMVGVEPVKKKSSSGNDKVDELLDEFEEVFRDELGTMKDVKVKLTVKEDVKPKFYRARPLAYVLKPAVGDELDKLVNHHH